MKLSNQIRPISYLKAHAAEILRTLAAQGEPLVITQNGEAKAVVQDIRSYEQDAGDPGVAQDPRAGEPSGRSGSGATRGRRDRTAPGAATGWLMSFLVQLTDDATRDLEEICDYIERHDAPGRADYVLDQIEKVLQSLSEHPRRGNYPHGELLELGIREYRELFFRPYRIIYRVIGKQRLRAGHRRWTA